MAIGGGFVVPLRCVKHQIDFFGAGLLLSFIVTLLFLPESLQTAKQSYEMLLPEYVYAAKLVN